MKKSFAELAWLDSLPSPPGVGSSVLKLMQRADCTAEEISNVLRADAVSIGRLLRCANSARSRSTPPFSTIESAAAHLGVRAVREVALDLALLPSDGASRCAAFDYAWYWSRSLARAIAARRIAVELGLEQPAEAYVLGLLAEVGSLALASIHPTEYAAILAAHAEPSRTEQCRAERERFDVDHVEISAYLMEEWGLPATFGRALQLRDRADSAHEHVDLAAHESAGRIELYAELLRGADAIVELHDDANVSAVAIERRRVDLERLRERLALDATAFRALCGAIGEQWTE